MNECWEREENMEFSVGFNYLRETVPHGKKTCEAPLHAIISGMRETRQASVFDVFAPPLLVCGVAGYRAA